MDLSQLLIKITRLWPRDPIILGACINLCVKPAHNTHRTISNINYIGVAWGWWVGLRVSVSSAETVVPLLQLVFPQGEESHVGANVTVIGPPSPLCGCEL